ncbi:hypothetical protein F0562_024952 [Nyssa sinensis]|uniref:Uncharacterized protein n=1 Tax=Nyssa sinensis TaxID=561372 RepID=A0A5J5BF53_9ASTE|nr:hypothetical protein F0562_024952 [Nyssa sinensis]
MAALDISVNSITKYYRQSKNFMLFIHKLHFIDSSSSKNMRFHPAPNDSASQLRLGMAPPSNALSPFHPEAPQPYNAVASLPIASHLCNNVGYYSGYMESKDNNLVNSFWIQHPYSNNTKNLMEMQSQMVASEAVTIQQEASQDYDEMHPFFDTVDDRQSYIDSKEAYESSLESSLKDTTQSIEHVAENELKSAAACFSLTSVN